MNVFFCLTNYTWGVLKDLTLIEVKKDSHQLRN